MLVLYIYHDWICLNLPKKQGSEFAPHPKYGKVLNTAQVSICKHYTEFWMCYDMPWQISEYISDSKYDRILNMQELHTRF